MYGGVQTTSGARNSKASVDVKLTRGLLRNELSLAVNTKYVCR